MTRAGTAKSRRAGSRGPTGGRWSRTTASEPGRPFVQIGCGREVLDDVAERLVDRDLLVIFARSKPAGEHLSDLSDHMAVVDRAGVAGDGQFRRLREHARPVISDVAGFLDQSRVDLDRAEIARADEVDVRS